MIPTLMTVGWSPPASSSEMQQATLSVVLPVSTSNRDPAFQPHQLGRASRRVAPPADAWHARGLSRLIAVETTTTSAPFMFSALSSMATFTPFVAQAIKRLRTVRDVGHPWLFVAEVGQHLGDPASANTADANKMHRTLSRGSFIKVALDPSAVRAARRRPCLQETQGRNKAIHKRIGPSVSVLVNCVRLSTQGASQPVGRGGGPPHLLPLPPCGGRGAGEAR